MNWMKRKQVKLDRTLTFATGILAVGTLALVLINYGQYYLAVPEEHKSLAFSTISLITIGGMALVVWLVIWKIFK